MRLDFGNLPLIEAQIQFMFHEPVSIGADLIGRLREALREELPVATISAPQPFGGHTEGTAFLSFGIPSGSGQFGNPETGIQVAVGLGGISVHWKKPFVVAKMPYPRYESMKAIVQKIFSVCGGHGIDDSSFANLNLTYVVYVGTGGVPETKLVSGFLTSDYIPKVAIDSKLLFDLSYSFRVLENPEWDWRIQIAPAVGFEEPGEQRGFLLITSGGANVESEVMSSLATLDLVHDRMQAYFISAITEEAKKTWQLR